MTDPVYVLQRDDVVQSPAFGTKLFKVLASNREKERIKVMAPHGIEIWFSAPYAWRVVLGVSDGLLRHFVLPDEDITENFDAGPAPAAGPNFVLCERSYSHGIEEGRNQVVAALISILRREL